jgi:site-specific DNA-methyltransferase (adenine-specific)
MIKPYYEQDGITIYHGDCREILPSLPKVDLVLTDPPYGMNNNPDSSRFSGGTPEIIARRGNGGGRFKQPIVGDDTPFDPSPFLDFEKVILWGFNHFASRLPVGSTLVWIKRFDAAFGTFLSDAELGWMKGGCGVYCKRDLSLTKETRQRKHPNQKPMTLMTWCIEKAGDVQTILDPFMGSGTTLVAAKQLHRKAIGIEIEEKYCQIACKRLAQGVLPI